MTDQPTDEGRRSFLKLAGAAAPAAAAVAVAPKSADAAAAGDDSLMQDTEHTRKYLDSARF
ncbi:MAG: twin-arginine translocation pathway signal protein [Pseudomonadota bacterium]